MFSLNNISECSFLKINSRLSLKGATGICPLEGFGGFIENGDEIQIRLFSCATDILHYVLILRGYDFRPAQH